MKVRLLPPSEKYRESFLCGLRAFRREGLAWHVSVDLAAVEADFAAFVAGKLADAHPRTDNLPPKTHLWAVEELPSASSKKTEARCGRRRSSPRANR